jgi:glycosyltransferase involved in cell wall biosynthesis
MNDPLFSVLVCTYNQEKFIAQTLNSIIEQKHNYPYEIIIGDDFSTDNTRNILLKYKENYPNIIELLLNETNYGMIKNYFNVLAHCSGKYIMQCAGDDWWLQGKVVSQIQFMEGNLDVGMCYGKAQIMDKYGNNLYSSKNKLINKFEELIIENQIPALTVCLRRNLILEYIETIDPLNKKWLMEDYPLFLWFSFNSKIYFINNFLGVYRYLKNSLSHPNDFLKKEEFIYSTYEIKCFFTNLYGILYLNKRLKNDTMLLLASNAAYYKNFKSFKKYISKIDDLYIKIYLKKIIGKSFLLFIIYHYYLRMRVIINTKKSIIS